jgi:UDP-3-O-[3-hydroxymyristoyl] glucosamine N-acyltransferase
MMRLVQLAELLRAELRGDAVEQQVDGVNSISRAGATEVVFAEDEPILADALASQAGAVIASSKIAAGIETAKPLLLTQHPRLAFARAARLLHADEIGDFTHPTAIVEASVVRGRRVSIAAYAVIEADVHIGENSSIGTGAVIGRGVIIGRGCRLYPRVVVYPGVELGDRVIVHAGAVLGADGFGYVRDDETGEYLQMPQQGRLVIEDDVEIGANTTIDRGALEQTRIASGVKIDNLVHIGHNVAIGKNVVIAAQTGVSGSSTVGENAVVGGQVGIADHVTIGDGVILGAQSGIPSNKKLRGPGVVFWGTPARPIKEYLKELAILSRLKRS